MGGAGASRVAIVGRRLAAGLAALTVLAQIAYPLSTGEPLRLLTIATVVLFAAASVIHAASTRGLAAAVVLVIVAGGIGLLAEAVGVRTGFPFGEYAYADSLGPKVLGVPVIVPLAWLMMAYPCLLLGRRLARTTARRGHNSSRPSGAVAVLTGGLTLAAWDLFLDPQMVAAEHWSWAHPTPALPGIPGVPLTNYAGWIVVALVLMAALQWRFPDRPRAPEAVPGAMLAWTWLGSTLGNAVFFGRPLVALWGGVLMGFLVLPYLRVWRGDRP
jgi:carotene biosynthesis associated membrane protein